MRAPAMPQATAHKPQPPKHDVPREREPGTPPVEPDGPGETPVQPIIPEDPEPERVIAPATNPARVQEPPRWHVDALMR